MSRAIALVDVNNCFAASERVFQPHLATTPLVVLSSNDAVAIARSAEAKALGVKMAASLHEFVHLVKSHGLVLRSANFSLYTNLSERTRTVFEQFTDGVVPYSIDECFLDITGLGPDGAEAYAREIQHAVLKQVGLPVGIGVATTKTAAKAANWGAKNYAGTKGVVDLYTDPTRLQRLLDVMPVQEVWGVGKATARKLDAEGIATAGELAKLELSDIKSRYGVVLARTVNELQGVEILPWEQDYQVSQQIIASRSLGTNTDDKATLLASIIHHVERAARKLREQDAVARHITVSLHTSGFGNPGQPYSPSKSTGLPQTTSDSSLLAHAARSLFESMYKPGYRYTKTGIIVSQIIPSDQVQEDLFSMAEDTIQKSQALMGAIDNLNNRFGLGTISLASKEQGDDWKPKSEWCSDNYTGNWSQLPVVKA